MEVLLRSPIPSDSNVLFAWRTDPEVNHFSKRNSSFLKSEHEDWFRARCSRIQREPFWIAISENRPIGFIRFDLKPGGDSLQLSYLVDSSFRGLGLGAKIIKLALDTGTMNECSFPISAICHSQNLASMKTLKRLNFEEVGASGDFMKFILVRA